MSFLTAKLRDALGQDGPGERIERMPCAWCKVSTSVAVLNHLGARCEACFKIYCEAPLPPGKPPRIPKPAASPDSAAAHVELPPRVPFPDVPVLDDPPLDVESEYFGEQDHDPNPLPASAAGPQ